MKVKTLELLWHGKMPILAIDFDNSIGGKNKSRFATAGGDSCIRIWSLDKNDPSSTVGISSDNDKLKNSMLNSNPNSSENATGITYLSTISRHTQPVNCVRWHPTEPILASAGDDGCIIISEEDKDGSAPIGNLILGSLNDNASDNVEQWKTKHFLRGASSEIYDLAWSPCGRFIISACIDNTARVFSLASLRCISVLTDHTNFVQGVSWDPLNQFFCTQSADRSLLLYDIKESINALNANQSISANSTVASNSKNRNSQMHNMIPIKFAKFSDIRKRTRVALADEINQENAQISDSTVDVNAGKTNKLAVDTPTKPKGGIENFLTKKSSVLPSSIVDNNNDKEANPANNIPNNVAEKEVILKPEDKIDNCIEDSSNKSKIKTVDPNPIKLQRIFIDEQLTSFFRRCTFSPDGALIITPCGLYQKQNSVYLYLRSSFSANNPYPIAQLNGFKKAAIAIRFSSVLHKPFLKEEERLLKFPGYCMIYAIACQDSVLVFSTDSVQPIAVVGNLHYATLTDVTFSPDGLSLMMTSTDGFVSIIYFDKGDLSPISDVTCKSLLENEVNKKEAITQLVDSSKNDENSSSLPSTSAKESKVIFQPNVRSNKNGQRRIQPLTLVKN